MVLFSPMVSGWVGGRKKFVQAVSQKVLSVGVNIWWGHWLGGVGVQHHSVTLI